MPTPLRLLLRLRLFLLLLLLPSAQPSLLDPCSIASPCPIINTTVCTDPGTLRRCGQASTNPGCICLPSSVTLCKTSDDCLPLSQDEASADYVEYCIRISARLFCVDSRAAVDAGADIVRGKRPLPSPNPPRQSVAPSPESSLRPLTTPISFDPCVAVKHLRVRNDSAFWTRRSSVGLKFERHSKAYVLCDDVGNCATRGHIVWLQAVGGMMMSSYCAIVSGGCKQHVMLVNSPTQWVPALRRRGDSGRPAMWFTDLAAKWGTVVEEKVLVRVLALQEGFRGIDRLQGR